MWSTCTNQSVLEMSCDVQILEMASSPDIGSMRDTEQEALSNIYGTTNAQSMEETTKVCKVRNKEITHRANYTENETPPECQDNGPIRLYQKWKYKEPRDRNI
eukprot:882060_1